MVRFDGTLYNRASCSITLSWRNLRGRVVSLLGDCMRRLRIEVGWAQSPRLCRVITCLTRKFAEGTIRVEGHRDDRGRCLDPLAILIYSLDSRMVFTNPPNSTAHPLTFYGPHALVIFPAFSFFFCGGRRRNTDNSPTAVGGTCGRLKHSTRKR